MPRAFAKDMLSGVVRVRAHFPLNAQTTENKAKYLNIITQISKSMNPCANVPQKVDGAPHDRKARLRIKLVRRESTLITALNVISNEVRC